MTSRTKTPVRQTVSIRDVARSAGVSVGTVSRVLNDHPSVAESRRQAVRAAIEELRYRPNANAQSLRRGTNRTIGVVVPDLRNPFFADLMQNIEISARAFGYSVLFVCSDEDAATERRAIEMLVNRKVDGIILTRSNRASETRPLPGLSSLLGLPIIAVDRPSTGHVLVAADHHAGGRLAAEYLVSLGHRWIACISGPRESEVAQARLAGFLDVMAPRYAAAGLPAGHFVRHGAFDYASGREAAASLFEGGGPAPTAIFASSDQQAIGVLRAAVDHGIAVPRELSVVGFDGIMVTDLVTPRLTTVAQPVARIANAAVTLLLDPGTQEGAAHLFACELIERESTAPPMMAPARTA